MNVTVAYQVNGKKCQLYQDSGEKDEIVARVKEKIRPEIKGIRDDARYEIWNRAGETVARGNVYIKDFTDMENK